MQIMAGIILPRVNDLGKAGDEFFHGRASTLNPRLESSHASPSNPRLQPPAPYAIPLSELLRVLDRPDIPLHTNGSENDIRAQVTRRKVSGGTRSDMGRDCRDVFLSLMKTCQKLGVSFWNYLGTRLAVPDQPAIPYLPDLVRTRFRPA